MMDYDVYFNCPGVPYNTIGGGGFDTSWDEHHDGGVVGLGGQFLLSANYALSGQYMH